MATNKSTIKALERMHEIIDNLESGDESLELKTLNKILKKHISSQKIQDCKFPNDDYIVGEGMISRRRKGEIITRY